MVLLVICGLRLLSLPQLYPSLDVFQRLEWSTYDWRMQSAYKRSTNALAKGEPGNITVVSNLALVVIDDDSLKEINDTFRFTWPWPRCLHGDMVLELSRQGALATGFDILFRELHKPQAATDREVPGLGKLGSDEYFAYALKQSSNVALAAMGQMESNVVHLLMPAEPFVTNAWAVGHITATVDSDGVLRRMIAYRDDPRQGRVWNLAMLMAARALGADLNKAEVTPNHITLHGTNGVVRVIPTDRDGSFYINWVLNFSDPRIFINSFQGVLAQAKDRREGKPVEADFKDKLVFIGSLGSGNNISDVGSTPLSHQTYVFGKYPNAVNSILTGQFIRTPPVTWDLLWIVLLGLLAMVLAWEVRPLLSATALLTISGLYVLAAWWLFIQHRIWQPIFMPVGGGLFFTYVCATTYRVVFEQKEQRRVKGIFSKIVSPNVVNELLKTDRMSLGGAQRRVTVFFADIRGFTEMTDQTHARSEEYLRQHTLTPQEAEIYMNQQARELLATVNMYLGAIADVVKKYDGTLDKYIGDCVMAFWGAPTPNEKHASCCVRAAIDAQRAIYALNQQRAIENKRREEENKRLVAGGESPLPMLNLLALGSGISSGVVTVGLMGSEAHIVNYTVFGREVNLASRLEGVSGRGRIIISEPTYEELKQTDAELADTCITHPPVMVKGMRNAIKVFEVPWKQEEKKV